MRVGNETVTHLLGFMSASPCNTVPFCAAAIVFPSSTVRPPLVGRISGLKNRSGVWGGGFCGGSIVEGVEKMENVERMN